MAFLNASDYQVVPSTTVETRIFGISTKQTRSVTEYLLTWACDGMGGEVPPATYNGVSLSHHGPEVAYGGTNGLYVALYRNEGAWS